MTVSFKLIRYDPACLRSFRSAELVSLSAETVSRVQYLGLRQHRGRRAGRAVQSGLPVHQRLGSGACIVSGYRPLLRHRRIYGSERPTLVSVQVQRNIELLGRALNFESMNVCLLSPLKLHGLLVEQRDCYLDVMLLGETWHDRIRSPSVDCVSMASALSRVPDRIYVTLTLHSVSTAVRLPLSPLLMYV